MPSYIVVARHAERLDYDMRDNKGQNWTSTAARPFDTPVTAHGLEQGTKLGRHLRQELEKRGLPPIAAVYASPLLRCRQTAAQASRELPNIDKVYVEDGLVESIQTAWYRSWGLPGSDGTWNYHMMKNESTLSWHEMAFRPVQELLDWQTADATINDQDAVSVVQDRLDIHYKSHCQLPPYTVHQVESDEDQRQRMRTTIEALMQPNSTILVVSHGGPITHLFEELTGQHWSRHGMSSYACYSLYENNGTNYKALQVNQAQYLHEEIIAEQHV